MIPLRPAYDFLRLTAFYDIPLPKRIRLGYKKLEDAYGYYYSSPAAIEIDASIKRVDKLLRVLAHELCHASLEQAAACDHERHDDNFMELSRIVCDRLGWKMGDV